MIKKRYFLPLLAALALTSCSENNYGGPDEPENKDLGYVAVNIVQAKNAAGRAEASEGYEYGSDDENYAEEGLFFIFTNTATPTLVNLPQRVALNKAADQTNKPEVEAVYNAVLVIDGQDTKPESVQILCVLNAPAALESGVTAGVTKLEELEKKIGDYSAAVKGKFIMTNSVYRESAAGAKVLGAVVGEENIKNTANEALSAPVEIYVERVVAKIRAKYADNFKNEGAEIVVDGETKKLTIDIKGFTISNVVDNNAYLFKNIEGFGTAADDAYSTWVWDAINKRSYWETMPEGLTYKNVAYNDIKYDDTKEFFLDNVYVLPNTSAQKTAVTMTAQLKLDGNPFDFVFLRGGYFTPEKALNLIAQYVANGRFWKKTADNTYEQLASSDFEWKDGKGLAAEDVTLPYALKSYEQVARVKGTPVVYTRKTDGTYEASSVEAVNTYLAGDATKHPYVARVYDKGMCYYYVNIDQSPVAGTSVAAGTYEGVVRNHIYELTINSVKGIGTPVFDPSEVIVPDKPDDENLYYLSARINVLAWRVVSQNVNFGK